MSTITDDAASSDLYEAGVTFRRWLDDWDAYVVNTMEALCRIEIHAPHLREDPHHLARVQMVKLRIEILETLLLAQRKKIDSARLVPDSVEAKSRR